jgi:hypothetical protein
MPGPSSGVVAAGQVHGPSALKSMDQPMISAVSRFTSSLIESTRAGAMIRCVPTNWRFKVIDWAMSMTAVIGFVGSHLPSMLPLASLYPGTRLVNPWVRLDRYPGLVAFGLKDHLVISTTWVGVGPVPIRTSPPLPLMPLPVLPA